MAAPASTTAIWDTVVVETDQPSGITPVNVGEVITGTVRLIGDNVTRVSIGQYVLFHKRNIFSQDGETVWAAVPQSDILLIYTTPP